MSTSKGKWQRKYKRVNKSLFKKLSSGFFEDCNWHVARVVEREGDGVSGISLFDGLGTSCSYYHCRPLPLSPAKARERLEYAKSHTWLEYKEKYVYGVELNDAQRAEEEKRDETWDFRRPSDYIQTVSI